jgi:hypothetical protein
MGCFPGLLARTLLLEMGLVALLTFSIFLSYYASVRISHTPTAPYSLHVTL